MILLDQAGAGRERAAVLTPPEHVTPLVEHAFVQRHVSDERTGWRIVPDSRASILVSVSRRTSVIQCTIAGARSRFIDVDIGGRRITCGLRLQIGALPVLFGVPARDFTDRVVPLACLTGEPARALGQRLEESRAVSAILQALFAFVADASRGRAPMCDPRAFDGAARVSQIGRHLDRAPRATYNRIVAQVGLPPKAVLRVDRLHRALHAAGAGASWSAAALAAGFADQPHLVRDCRRLLGETPAQWQRRARCRFVQDRARAAT